LEIVLKSINDLSARVTDELAHPGSSVMDDDQEQPAPVSAVGNRQVGKAIDLLTVGVVNRMQGPGATRQVTSDILLMFGNAMPQAIPRIKEVVDLLRELYNRSSPAGYVVDETLPSSIGALGANTGVRATSYIRLRTSALNGTMSAPDLACTLMHEGSHLIADSTVDFAYRGSRQHYFLPPELALYNAANYEQIAVNAIGSPDQPPGEPEIAAARDITAQPPLLAASLLTAQITRAWIRSYQTAGNFRTGQILPGQTIVAALELPAAAWAASLVQALLDGTFNAIDELNETAQKSIELRDGDMHQQDTTIRSVNGGSAVRFPQGTLRSLRPRDLARDALRAMCNLLATDNYAPATTSQLFAFVDGVDAFEDQRLRSRFTAYVDKVAAASSTSEQLEDYYRQRVDDI
jgi:hypothetical protein